MQLAQSVGGPQSTRDTMARHALRCGRSCWLLRLSLSAPSCWAIWINLRDYNQ